MFSSKQTHAQIRLFHLLPPRIWVARDQTQPGYFSRERKEPGNEVGGKNCLKQWGFKLIDDSKQSKNCICHHVNSTILKEPKHKFLTLQIP